MIDAHQHFWQLGRNACTWPTPELTRIHRDYLPSDLRPLMTNVGVSGTVLVQTQPSDRDTDYLCTLAADTDWVSAVVGWVDLASPSAPERIAELAGRPKFRGLRPMLQDLPDDAIADPAFEPAIAAMIAQGLSFDALVRPRHLPSLHSFAGAHPRLRIVIDHAAKPDIAQEILDPWRADMHALAALPNVYCKLSGLVTEARADWREADLAPYVTHVLSCFGARRVMWGSDWPVLELATDYSTWVKTVQSLTRELNRDEAAAVFESTAAELYRLS